MDRLCLYAVFSVDEPPKPLLFRRTSEGIAYNCQLPLPLPHQAVVFGFGKWEQRTLGKSLTVELTLDEGETWQRLGTLTDKHRSLCWQGEWRDDFLRRSIAMERQGGIATLKVTCGGSGSCGSPVGRQVVSSHHLPDTPIDTPKVPGKENLVKSTGIAEIQDEYTPPWDAEDVTLSETNAQEPTPKRRRTYSAKSRTLKEQLKSSPAEKKKTSTTSRSRKGSKKVEVDTEDSDIPSARWGHSLCPLEDHRALLIGGQGKGRQLCKDSIWQLDTVTQKWEVQSTTFSGPNPEARMGHTATYDPVVKCVYVFGGSKNKRWFSDVHVLDVQTWQWSSIEAKGDAPTRSYHSSTLYRHELFVFGGVFPNPDPEPDGCSNEVFVYSPATESWYKPLVMGDSPTPRSGHSAVLLGERLVVFGGWDAPVCYNDVSILDLCLMDWSQPEVTGTPPAPRSWHTAVPLNGNSFLVHGGYDGDEVMGDSFVFSLDTCSWSVLADPVPVSPCCGHQGLPLPRSLQDKENQEDNNKLSILIFGGGDNNGHFFNQLHRHTFSHDASGTSVGDPWC
ncbi:FBXO42 [Branchiostoma lanceolatum]|uniref:FBXO42 protein n=1 Tax=Branchiostoma lanceolatum TaxID=7740 RepID=A0A8J9ZX37_BRALA|nr:FBXO42 [Branchiostoma lanceolatum]